MSQNNYEKAKALIALGFAIFPCYSEDTWVGDRLYERKAPLARTRGFHDAFTDLDSVEAVWGPTGDQNLLVGVACGASHIIVLDIDMNTEKGKDGWFSITDNSLDVPDTFHYTTSSGGDHYVYKASTPELQALGNAKDYITTEGLILEDVDRRANGGYVIWWGDAPSAADLAAVVEPPVWFQAQNGSAGSLNPYDGLASDWIDALPQGKSPEYFVQQFLKELPQEDFGHDEMIKLQRNLVGYAAEGEPGVYEAIEVLRNLWLKGEYNTPQYEQDWNTSLAGAIKKYGGAQSEQEKEFWTRRPVLQHLYKQSRSELECSPWALLGITITRAIHLTPWYVRYRSNKGAASINTVSTFVGPTSAGKSLLQRQADEVIGFVGHGKVRAVEIGSGEAMSEEYGILSDEVVEDEQGKLIKSGRKQFTWNNPDHNAQFAFDEVGRLENLQGRKGSTILDYIKTGYSGAPFGRKLVQSSGGGMLIPEDEYRFTMYLNAQPRRSGVLLTTDEISSGLPSRFLWMNVVDPLVEKEAQEVEPEKMMIHLPSWTNPNPYGYGEGMAKLEPDFIDIKATPKMNAAHKADYRAGMRGEKSDIDGHVLLTRAKVAVAFMLLDSRSELNDEDWELAGVVITHSIATRNMVLTELAKAQEAAVEAQGAAQGRREAAAEESKEETVIQKFVNLITEEQDKPNFSLSKLRTNRSKGKTANRPGNRHLFDEAAYRLGLADRPESND